MLSCTFGAVSCTVRAPRIIRNRVQPKLLLHAEPHVACTAVAALSHVVTCCTVSSRSQAALANLADFDDLGLTDGISSGSTSPSDDSLGDENTDDTETPRLEGPRAGSPGADVRSRGMECSTSAALAGLAVRRPLATGVTGADCGPTQSPTHAHGGGGGGGGAGGGGSGMGADERAIEAEGEGEGQGVLPVASAPAETRGLEMEATGESMEAATKRLAEGRELLFQCDKHKWSRETCRPTLNQTRRVSECTTAVCRHSSVPTHHQRTPNARRLHAGALRAGEGGGGGLARLLQAGTSVWYAWRSYVMHYGAGKQMVLLLTQRSAATPPPVPTLSALLWLAHPRVAKPCTRARTRTHARADSSMHAGTAGARFADHAVGRWGAPRRTALYRYVLMVDKGLRSTVWCAA